MTQALMSARRLLILAVLAMTACVVSSARAHTPSETYLTVSVTPTNVTGQWEVAVLDLEQGSKVQPEKWQAMSGLEKDQWLEAMVMDTVGQLLVRADEQPLRLQVTDLEPVKLSAGDYQRVRFSAVSPPAVINVITIDARALFLIDTNMHGLLRVEHAGRTEAAAFNADHAVRAFTLSQPASRWAQAWTFIHEGVGHIWAGPDHILFLVALLLPAVFRNDGGKWAGLDAFGPALVRVLKIVTAFTIAHSLTLSLAVLDIVRVTPRVIEPLIAASVIAAAGNNLRPWFGERGWMVAFGFGLVHGFGLAGGLIEFGLRRETLAMALVSYNVGVELGQLAIVSLVLPFAYAIGGSWFYRIVAFRFGSAAVALIAGLWMAERLFEFKMLPF